MGSFEELKYKFMHLLRVFADNPVETAQNFLLFFCFLVLVVLIFNWKVQKAIAKQRKIQKKREKVLKLLQGNRYEQATLATEADAEDHAKQE
ncbi:unnamed protein product [Auanema sp. JU1783]|nr:unnamed protein product [Auanema sp. JU1783]